MSVFHYGFGVLHWTQAELRGLDTKTRKVLAKAKFQHEQYDVHRICLSRRDGGRGLVGLVDTQRQECTKLAQYVERSEDTLFQIVKVAKGQPVHGLMPWAQVVNKGGTTNDINEYHKRGLDNMEIHGKLAKLASVDIEGGHKWLHSAHLPFETESLICAAQ